MANPGVGRSTFCAVGSSIGCYNSPWLMRAVGAESQDARITVITIMRKDAERRKREKFRRSVSDIIIMKISEEQFSNILDILRKSEGYQKSGMNIALLF